MKSWSLFRVALVALLSFALFGCFRSVEPLIGEGEADHPFESVTYVQAGGGEEVTLVRSGDAYRPANEDTDDRVWLKVLDENLYLAQLAPADASGPGYMYGIVRVAPDRKSFVMTASVAEASDIAALSQDHEGLGPCPDDPETVCIENDNAYIAYSEESEVARRKTVYNILKME